MLGVSFLAGPFFIEAKNGKKVPTPFSFLVLDFYWHPPRVRLEEGFMKSDGAWWRVVRWVWQAKWAAMAGL